MIKTEMVKVLAMAFELDLDNSDLMLSMLRDTGLVEENYINEVIDWLEDENLRQAILKDNKIAEEFKKSLNKIVRYIKSKNFDDEKYKDLVNQEVDKMEEITKIKNIMSDNDWKNFKSTKRLAYNLVKTIKENKDLLD